MSPITILAIKSADRALTLSRYDAPLYWDVSLPTIHRVTDEKLVKAFDEPVNAKTVLPFVIERCTGTVILDSLIPKSGLSEALVYQLINAASYGPS